MQDLQILIRRQAAASHLGFDAWRQALSRAEPEAYSLPERVAYSRCDLSVLVRDRSLGLGSDLMGQGVAKAG